MQECLQVITLHHPDHAIMYVVEFNVVFLGTNTKLGLECYNAYGVESGDTCNGIINYFGLKSQVFYSTNPNIDCDDLFLGQWVCVRGTPGPN